MKTCPKCNTTGIPDYAKFCPVCGEPFIEEKETQTKHVATTVQSSVGSSRGKVIVIVIIIIAAIIGVMIFVNNQANDSTTSPTALAQPQQSQILNQDNQKTNSDGYAEDNTIIRSVLSRLSTSSSKNGNQSELSSLYASEVNPYVNWGTTKKSVDIPSATRQFLDRYDYYEVSTPTDLSVKPYNEGYVATYKIIVEWNSQRTGHKKACIQKTTYFDSNYMITGFIDNELWRIKL